MLKNVVNFFRISSQNELEFMFNESTSKIFWAKLHEFVNGLSKLIRDKTGVKNDWYVL